MSKIKRPGPEDFDGFDSGLNEDFYLGVIARQTIEKPELAETSPVARGAGEVIMSRLSGLLSELKSHPERPAAFGLSVGIAAGGLVALHHRRP